MPPWLGTFFISEYYFELKGTSLSIKPSILPEIWISQQNSTKHTLLRNWSENNLLMAAGINWLISIKKKDSSMLQYSTVLFLFNYRLVFKRCWSGWEFINNEESKEIYFRPRRYIRSTSDDKIQISSIWPIWMALTPLHSTIHFQKLVPILPLIHKRLHRSMGLPTSNRFRLFKIPQNHLSSI